MCLKVRNVSILCLKVCVYVYVYIERDVLNRRYLGFGFIWWQTLKTNLSSHSAMDLLVEMTVQNQQRMSEADQACANTQKAHYNRKLCLRVADTAYQEKMPHMLSRCPFKNSRLIFINLLGQCVHRAPKSYISVIGHSGHVRLPSILQHAVIPRYADS